MKQIEQSALLTPSLSRPMPKAQHRRQKLAVPQRRYRLWMGLTLLAFVTAVVGTISGFGYAITQEPQNPNSVGYGIAVVF